MNEEKQPRNFDPADDDVFDHEPVRSLYDCETDEKPRDGGHDGDIRRT